MIDSPMFENNEMKTSLACAINEAHGQWLRENVEVIDGEIFVDDVDGYLVSKGMLADYIEDESMTLCDALDLPHESLEDVTEYDDDYDYLDW